MLSARNPVGGRTTSRHLATAPSNVEYLGAVRRGCRPRVRALYRAWQRQGMEAIWTAQSPCFRDAVDRRDGRLEYHDLWHHYLQCAGLIGQRRAARRGDKCETRKVGPPPTTSLRSDPSSPVAVQ